MENGKSPRIEAKTIKVTLSNDESGLMELKRIIEKDLKIKEFHLHNKFGHEMTDDDYYFIRPDHDIVYVVPSGQKFDFSSYLCDFETLQKLGQGGFGSVYLIRHKVTREQYAAKFIDISEYMHKADQVTLALKEIQSM